LRGWVDGDKIGHWIGRDNICGKTNRIMSGELCVSMRHENSWKLM